MDLSLYCVSTYATIYSQPKQDMAHEINQRQQTVRQLTNGHSLFNIDYPPTLV